MTSDQRLVAEAVAVALSSARPGSAVVVPWPGVRPGVDRSAARPPVGLLMSDLDAVATVQAAQLALARAGTDWLAMTAAPPGAVWGAVLEAGAIDVVPSSAGLLTVAGRLATLADGPRGSRTGDAATGAGHAAYLDLWHGTTLATAVAAGRLPLLSAPERAVLEELAAGRTPREVRRTHAGTHPEVAALVRRIMRRLAVATPDEAVSALRLAVRAEALPGASPAPR
ncbi:hypothetical protein [Nocardioides imazamoxiresistens]|uniref:hypothetical protein n=1 Tax=Nocardioides imazamoxiresistens TaxID=3231893 RepID=UPI0028EACDB3|nr:hypothetical protein [Nocardioides zeae]